MCLVTDTAKKLNVNVRDVFALAAEASPNPEDAQRAFLIWFHEQFALGFVRQYCIATLAITPKEADDDMA